MWIECLQARIHCVFTAQWNCNEPAASYAQLISHLLEPTHHNTLPKCSFGKTELLGLDKGWSITAAKVSERCICSYFHKVYHVNQNRCKEVKPPQQATWTEHQQPKAVGQHTVSIPHVRLKDEDWRRASGVHMQPSLSTFHTLHGGNADHILHTCLWGSEWYVHPLHFNSAHTDT